MIDNSRVNFTTMVVLKFTTLFFSTVYISLFKNNFLIKISDKNAGKQEMKLTNSQRANNSIFC